MTAPRLDPAPGVGRPWVRAVVDYGGPLVFLVGYFVSGRDLVQATWWLVGGSALALAVGWLLERRIAPLPLFAGLMALVFGALTLIFHDVRFVKMKPTFINLALAAAMLGGYALKREPLKLMLGDSIRLPAQVWRVLTLRYGVFFMAVAVTNEAVWRLSEARGWSDDIWVWWRMPGLQVLALLFSLAQTPLMLKHLKQAEGPPPPVE